MSFECLACYRCSGQEKWKAQILKDKAFKFLFCQLRPSRKMQHRHCSPVWALRLSLTSWILPEIPGSLLSLLKTLPLCPKDWASHYVQEKGQLRSLTRGPVQWERITLGHGTRSFSSFHQASENLSPCRGTWVKAVSEYSPSPSSHALCQWVQSSAAQVSCPGKVSLRQWNSMRF